MLAHHRGLSSTPEQRFRFASLRSLAADDAALPADPEFRAAVIGYVEWETRLALHNSQPDAEVVDHPSLAGVGASHRRTSLESAGPPRPLKTLEPAPRGWLLRCSQPRA